MVDLQRSPSVLYFAVRYDFYPRNRRIRQYLEQRYGADITIVPALIRGNVVVRYLRQLKLALKAGSDYDLVVLAEFNLHYFPFSWIAAKRSKAPHVVDFFVGKYESAVLDRQTHAPRSLRARSLRLVDKWAILSSTLCLTDTGVRAREFSAIAADRRSFRVLPVGAPPWAYPRADAHALTGTEQTAKLLYYGNYIPLHGLGAVVAALPLVGSPVEVTLIGNGKLRAKIENEVARLGFSDRVTFLGHIDESELAAVIADHDVVLGIFGTSSKAAGVIANKVWQGLYMGKTVVTRASEALDDISEICGDHLVQVADADPASIAAAIDAAIGHARSRTGVDDTIAARLDAHVVSQFDSVFDELLSAPAK